MGLVDQFVNDALGVGIHAETLEFQPAGVFVEQTQHNPLAMPGWHRGDANVHGATRDAQRESSVLRQALLGDVEFRHDLDARYHQRCDGTPRLQDLAQHAVDAKTHDQPVFKRLDVDVRCIVLHGGSQQGIDQPDDRCIVIAFEQVGRFRQFLCDPEQVRVFTESVHHLHGGVRFPFVGLLQLPVEVGCGYHPQAEWRVDETPDLGYGREAHALAHEQQRAAILESVDQHTVALGERKWQQLAARVGLRRRLLAQIRVSGREISSSGSVPPWPVQVSPGSPVSPAGGSRRSITGGSALVAGSIAGVSGSTVRSVCGISRRFFGLICSC